MIHYFLDMQIFFRHNVCMNKIYNKNETTYFCDFLFNDVEFSVFLDPTFFNNVFTPHRSTPHPVHSHAHHELLSILSGTSYTRTEDSTFTIENQQCVFIPAKTFHSSYSTDTNSRLISIAFSFKNIKKQAKNTCLYSNFTKIFNQDKPVIISNSKKIFELLNQLKDVFNSSDIFMHFQIQSILQEIILSLATNLYKQLENDILLTNFSYGKNLPYLINLKINKFLTTTDLKTIADELFISKRHLERYIKKTFNMTFSERRTFLRIETAKNLLLNSNLSIEQIVQEIGFSNKTHFYKKFKELTGNTPSEYRKLYSKD